MRFTPAGNGGAAIGESPFWDHGDFVWWVDIVGQRLLRTRLSTHETCSWSTPELPGFVVLAEPDRPMVGMETGIFAFSPVDGGFIREVAFEGEGLRFNDATVDGTGRLWASTMAIDVASGCAALHMVTEDLELRAVLDGLTTPNGLAADMDRKRLFISDSHPQIRSIWTAACDFTTGEIASPVEFASMRQLAGRPDGAALATDGGYWIAGVDGGALYGFSEAGLLKHKVTLPFAAPTKLAFFTGGVAVTAKGEGGYGGQIALATTDVPSVLRGPAVPFWRPRGRPLAA